MLLEEESSPTSCFIQIFMFVFLEKFLNICSQRLHFPSSCTNEHNRMRNVCCARGEHLFRNRNCNKVWRITFMLRAWCFWMF